MSGALTDERIAFVLFVHFIAAWEETIGVDAVKPQHVAQVLTQPDLVAQSSKERYKLLSTRTVRFYGAGKQGHHCL